MGKNKPKVPFIALNIQKRGLMDYVDHSCKILFFSSNQRVCITITQKQLLPFKCKIFDIIRPKIY